MKHSFSISSDLLSLRPLAQEDIELLRLLRNRPENRCWFFDGKEIEPQAQAAWFSRYLEKPDDYMFSVELHTRGCPPPPPVGYIALYGREPGTNCYEIGRLLADSPRMPRRGMGNEIVRLATALAFSQLDADTLVANVMHNNERSLRCFRCNGFTADPALSDSETVTLILHKQEFHYF